MKVSDKAKGIRGTSNKKWGKRISKLRERAIRRADRHQA